jgi:hypothetical protein
LYVGTGSLGRQPATANNAKIEIALGLFLGSNIVINYTSEDDLAYTKHGRIVGKTTWAVNQGREPWVNIAIA